MGYSDEHSALIFHASTSLSMHVFIYIIQKFDVDLSPGDTLTIYDGAQSSDPVLATYTRDGSDGPEVIITTGQFAYVYMDTSSQKTGRGFQFLYSSGDYYWY